MAGRPQRSRKQIAEQRETRVRLSSPREAAHFVEVVRGYGFPAYAEGARAIAFAPREELRWALLATRGLTMREPLARDPGKVIPLFRRRRSRGPKRAPGTSAASPAFRALRREAQALGVRAEASADSGSSFQAARLHQETADAYRRLSDAYRKAGYEEDSQNAHFTSVGYATSAQHYLARLRETGRDPQRPNARQRQFISRKIPILVREGYPQPQAIAIAHSMAGVPRRRSAKRDPARMRRMSLAEARRAERLLEKRGQRFEAMTVEDARRFDRFLEERGTAFEIPPAKKPKRSRKRRRTSRDAPRTYPIAPGFRLTLRPFPFGAPGRELEWVVTKQDRPNLVFASGEAADVADARGQALRRIPGTATTRTSLRRLVGASSRRI